MGDSSSSSSRREEDRWCVCVWGGRGCGGVITVRGFSYQGSETAMSKHGVANETKNPDVMRKGAEGLWETCFSSSNPGPRLREPTRDKTVTEWINRGNVGGVSESNVYTTDCAKSLSRKINSA